MIVVDTNVLSELIRASPAEPVVAWARAQDNAAIYTTTICEAELLYGVALLPQGRRRSELARAVNVLLNSVLAGRILPFDRSAAVEYAHGAAGYHASGKIVASPDMQIAAIARARGALVLATRNTKDFLGCGVALVDPWDGP